MKEMNELETLKFENDMLRKMLKDVMQLNKLLLEDRAEAQSFAGLPELKPLTTKLAPAPKPAYPNGRWTP